MGFNQTPFRIIKFPHHAYARRRRRHPAGEARRSARHPGGAWLRRWNIDEIPQLIQRLKGDMSLSVRARTRSRIIISTSGASSSTRAGTTSSRITGWAQIHGFRGETDTDDRWRSGRAQPLLHRQLVAVAST